MNSHRFSHHLMSVGPQGSPGGSFVALPNAPAANSPQAGLYQAAYQAAVRTTRDRAFREYIQRTLFAAMN